ncbi:uncharacterized protein BO72DRAFT_253100 [Aspergillus fijiensis CBS 313.89]|uniref:Uncharacterized protein n=1 Tax=Aspergillus fijiensis CBS 313.89 TaxID=1448319 RepID=A0A8G1RM05_9EURO|nr:uncharacterized protein BO72DRAFT_253100 [Aspergillus fijiensis CBS 313.89]RAK72936.1 hypothetical protein BO72DRAFT_253100 [Aspergillus fijiensis CBS 313.89]
MHEFASHQPAGGSTVVCSHHTDGSIYSSHIESLHCTVCSLTYCTVLCVLIITRSIPPPLILPPPQVATIWVCVCVCVHFHLALILFIDALLSFLSCILGSKS